MAIGHRGASSYAPENTLASFDLALEMGANQIELDVHLTADGKVAVIHDETVDRTTNGSGPVIDLTLDALRGLDAGRWFGPDHAGQRVPSLDEVLGRYRSRLDIDIEIKGRTPGLVQQTIGLVRDHEMTAHATLTSFMTSALEEAAVLAPEIRTGWLVSRVTEETLDAVRDMQVSVLCPRADGVTSELVERLHAMGLLVRAWWVPDDSLMRRVIDMGVDGISVNFPDRLVAYLHRCGLL